MQYAQNRVIKTFPQDIFYCPCGVEAIFYFEVREIKFSAKILVYRKQILFLYPSQADIQVYLKC